MGLMHSDVMTLGGKEWRVSTRGNLYKKVMPTSDRWKPNFGKQADVVVCSVILLLELSATERNHIVLGSK